MNKRVMNRRGQFYLIAAIVIITIATGFIIISNSVSSQQTSNIYYQGSELKIESSSVISYATNNQLSQVQLTNNLVDLNQRYIDASQNENFYLVFGNSTNITFMSYQTYYSNVTLNNADYTNLVSTGSTYLQSFAPGSNVSLGINGRQYIFPINSGENFNFVLTSNQGGQNYTVSS